MASVTMDFSPRFNTKPMSPANYLASPGPSPISRESNYRYAATPRTADYFSHFQNSSDTGRKRVRHDSFDQSCRATMSPAPLANMNYDLAGGLETPNASITQYTPYENSPSDISFRRGRSYAHTNQHDYFHQHGGDRLGMLPGTVGNGLAPAMVGSSQTTTWSKMMTSIAGKVWDFCTGNFRGFYAGGGQGYSLSTPHPQPQPIQRPSGTPQIQSHELGGGSWQEVAPDTPQGLYTDDTRASKRSRTSRRDSDLQGNWVYVRSPSQPTTPALSQRSTTPIASGIRLAHARTPSTASAAPIRRAQPSSRPILNLRRTATSNPRTTSSAGLRSPLPTTRSRPDSRPGSSHRKSNSLNNSNGRSSDEGRTRRHSQTFAPATITIAREDHTESPLAEETRKHIERQRKREREENREFQRMNNFIQDMIRQGQEALGTKVEVEYEDPDRPLMSVET